MHNIISITPHSGHAHETILKPHSTLQVPLSADHDFSESAPSTRSAFAGSMTSMPISSAAICLTGPVNHLRAERNQKPSE